MRIKFLLLILTVVISAAVVPSINAQGVRSGPDPATLRDPELEKDSLHNLEVARNYFRLKKAYVAALSRCEEVIDGNPMFAKLEEVLLMAGQSSLWLSQNKGKQKPSLYISVANGEKRALTPEEFRAKSRLYLTRLIEEFPDGSYRKQAEASLSELGEAPKP